MWRPDEDARDQIRISLTRRYKSPTLADADTRLRLSAGNLAPLDFTTSSTIFADGQRQTSINGGATYTTVALRLELRR